MRSGALSEQNAHELPDKIQIPKKLRTRGTPILDPGSMPMHPQYQSLCDIAQQIGLKMKTRQELKALSEEDNSIVESDR